MERQPQLRAPRLAAARPAHHHRILAAKARGLELYLIP
jgi:hypothetical protein